MNHGKDKPVSRRRFVIFRPGSMGDTLVSVSVVWSLRRKYPEAIFEYIAEKSPDDFIVNAKDTLDLVPEVSRIFLYDPAGSGWDRLRRMRRYFAPGSDDTLLYLCYQRTSANDVLRDWVFFRMVGFRRIMGIVEVFRDAWRGCVPEAVESEHARLFRIMRSSGMDLNPDAKGRLRVDEEWADKFWDKHGLGGSKVVAVCPGSKIQTKKWPAARYAEVISRTSGAPGLAFVIIGGENDRSLAEEIIGSTGGCVVSAAGANLAQTSAILARALVYLGNDTGPMHLAALHGIPCVAVFSAWDREGKWYPIGNGHAVFREDYPCSSCFLDECFAGPPMCLSVIGVDTVAGALERILRGSQQSSTSRVST